MLSEPKRPDRDYTQAIAWLQLAAGQGLTEARQVLDREEPKLSPARVKSIQALKIQLARK